MIVAFVSAAVNQSSPHSDYRQPRVLRRPINRWGADKLYHVSLQARICYGNFPFARSETSNGPERGVFTLPVMSRPPYPWGYAFVAHCRQFDRGSRGLHASYGLLALPLYRTAPCSQVQSASNGYPAVNVEHRSLETVSLARCEQPAAKT